MVIPNTFSGRLSDFNDDISTEKAALSENQINKGRQKSGRTNNNFKEENCQE